MASERPAFIDHFCFRRKWRPTSIAAPEAPGDPGGAPFVTGSPDPAVIGQPDPASIMVSSPPEILVGNPCPPFIGVGPVAIGIRSPCGVVHGNVRLPAVAVITDLDPAPAAEVVVKEIDRNVLTLRLWRQGHQETDYRKGKQ